MRLESSRYPPVCGRSLNYRPHLPVQLQGELHAPRIVQDVAVTRQAAKVVVLQSLRARAEPYPVEDVESFPAEIKPELLVQGERLSHRDVLVVAGKVAQLRIVTGHVAEAVLRLRAEERRRLEEAVGLRIELALGLRA